MYWLIRSLLYDTAWVQCDISPAIHNVTRVVITAVNKSQTATLTIIVRVAPPPLFPRGGGSHSVGSKSTIRSVNNRCFSSRSLISLRGVAWRRVWPKSGEGEWSVRLTEWSVMWLTKAGAWHVPPPSLLSTVSGDARLKTQDRKTDDFTKMTTLSCPSQT